TSAMNMILKKKYPRSRPFRMSFLLGVLVCEFLTTTERAFSEIPLIAADWAWVASPVPTGVFSLTGFGRQIRGSTLSNPNVDGISVRDHWWHLEPSEGVYDWSTLDAYVAQITPSRKNILIRIGTMGGRHSLGGNMPDWVMDAVGANTITYYDSGGVLRTIPLFWDQTYLDKKTAMIAAIGARYSGNPLVKVATASFANRHSEDWSVPDSTQIDGIPPAGSSEASRMLAAGYTHQKMV